MAIPDPPKAGSPFCALWTGGWNPKTPKINNFFIPEITLRRERGGTAVRGRSGKLRQGGLRGHGVDRMVRQGVPLGRRPDTSMPTPPAAHQLGRADKHETVSREGNGITFL